MKRRRGFVAVSVAALGACALIALNAGGGPAERGTLALLGGTGAGSTVWRIDTSRQAVVEASRLRSFALAGDAGPNGAIVTAQCGGLGADTDDRLGIVEASGRVRYVRLPAPNPSDVAVVGTTAVVLHGFSQGSGMWLTAVDLARRSVIATSTISGAPIRLTAFGGRVLVTRGVGDGIPGACELAMIEPRTLAVSTVTTLPLCFAEVATEPDVPSDGRLATVVGFTLGDSPKTRSATSAAFRIDVSDGRVAKRLPLAGLSAGAFGGSVTGRTLAVLDSATAEPGPSDSVVLFDLDTGRMRRRIPARPLAVLADDRRIFVADGRTSSVRLFDHDGRRLGEVAVPRLGETAHLDALR